jgi:ATP-dependent DNA ligase
LATPCFAIYLWSNSTPRVKARVEEKYDNWRMVACKDGRNVRLVSRRGVDYTGRFAEVALCRSPNLRVKVLPCW